MSDDRIYEVDVAASPERAWHALTDPDAVRRYHYGTAPRTTRLAHTFVATWYGEADDQGSLHWEIAPTQTGCRITLTHRGARAQTRAGSETADGSRHVIESLKAVLEAAAA